MRDPQTGKQLTLTVIGVLSDSAPQFDGRDLDVAGARSRRVFGDRVLPTIHLFALRAGRRRRRRRRKQLESAFLANGMQADALAEAARTTPSPRT